MLGRMLGCCIAICTSAGIAQGEVYAQVQTSAYADTVTMSLEQAEQQFLENNLALVAQHYQVEAGKALIQQARLWDNPVLNTDQNVYSNNRYFEHGVNASGQPYGQYYIQVEQLIKTAGKRGKEIKMARTSAEISQLQLNDLMRNLKYQLRNDYYTLAQLQGKQALYAQGKDQLAKLLQGMEQQYKAGNIAHKDLLRVQALKIALEQEAAENGKQVNEIQAELQTLLHLEAGSYIKTTGAANTIALLPPMELGELYNTALQNNPAYKLNEMQLQYQQQNLAMQKAVAVPDVTIGPNFDKNSNYTPNYYGLAISLPLPAFNRNQGNIKAARWQVKSAETEVAQAKTELGHQLEKAYNNLKLVASLNTGADRQFYADYDQLYKNIMESYRQRQISLVEFIDYFEAYKDTKQQQLTHDLNLQMAKEELNYITGKDIIH